MLKPTKQTKVLLLGGTGMLGSMIGQVLSQQPNFKLTITVRDKTLIPANPHHEWRILDAQAATLDELTALLNGHTWAVNAIGVIKPYIHDDNAQETERAIRVNALFPHLLAKAAEQSGCQVLQIATDCVYSGATGQYDELSPHDALDVYGKTKSLGEVTSPSMHHLRCSIIGPEPKGKVSLLEWFLKQDKNATVNGFTNHNWNGITTYHFARLCQGIIQEAIPLQHLQHVIPTGDITKAELLTCFAKEYHRDQLTITPVAAEKVIDRTLATLYTETNNAIWHAAGYVTIPTVPDMVRELAHFSQVDSL